MGAARCRWAPAVTAAGLSWRAQAALAVAKAALTEDPFDPSAADAVRRAEVRLDVAGVVTA